MLAISTVKNLDLIFIFPEWQKRGIVQAECGRSLYEQLRATGKRAVMLEIPWAENAFDAVFNGVSNQLALYYTERFLAWTLKSSDYQPK